MFRRPCGTSIYISTALHGVTSQNITLSVQYPYKVHYIQNIGPTKTIPTMHYVCPVQSIMELLPTVLPSAHVLSCYSDSHVPREHKIVTPQQVIFLNLLFMWPCIVKMIFFNYNQQDATIFDYLFLKGSTCFGRFLRPSSVAHNCTLGFRYCQPILLQAGIVEEMEFWSSISFIIPACNSIG